MGAVQHLVYRGLLARHPVRLDPGGGKPKQSTSVLHLPRFLPFPPLLPCECLRVRLDSGLAPRRQVYETLASKPPFVPFSAPAQPMHAVCKCAVRVWDLRLWEAEVQVPRGFHVGPIMAL